MNHIISRRNSRPHRAAVLCALLLLLSAFALPVNASPPEPLNFELDLVFLLGNFTGTGSWQSSGILAASGHASQEEQLAGYDESGWFVRNVHATATLCNGAVSNCEDAEDTITIRSHFTNLDFVPFGPISGDGRWVITDATGAYAGLQGNGIAYFSGDFHFSCPEPSVIGPCITETLTFDGRGHFEP